MMKKNSMEDLMPAQTKLNDYENYHIKKREVKDEDFIFEQQKEPLPFWLKAIFGIVLILIIIFGVA